MQQGVCYVSIMIVSFHYCDKTPETPNFKKTEGLLLCPVPERLFALLQARGGV